MKKSEIRRTRNLIKGMSIPSRPTVMLEVIKAQNTFAPDLQKLASVISRDVTLASRVLQEANTVLPGLKRKVASIEQAVMLLGLPHIRRSVTSLFLNASLMGKEGPLQRLRHRCADVGRTAAFLAGRLPRLSPAYESGYLPLIPPDEAYALGLFHDCGLSLLMQKFSDYQMFYDDLHEGGGQILVDAENERFRTNHCLVGYLLCENWQLPKHLCEVIRDHHQTHSFVKPGKKIKDRRTVTMHALLKLAEHVNGELSNHEWEQVRPDLLQFFAIGDEELTILRNEAAQGADPANLITD